MVSTMEMKRSGFFFLAVLLLVSPVIAQPVTKAKEIYVSTTGNDNASGSRETPFKTLARAQAAIRTMQPIAAPVTVWVRGGSYYLNSPLTFTPADNGAVNAPVTYAAYPKEIVTISGGVKLKPKWTTHSGNIKVASIGTGYDFDMLFLNADKLLTLARYPNYDADKIPLQGCANIADRVAGWHDPSGGYIRAMHVTGWGGESYKITGKTTTGLTLQWVGDNNRGSVANLNRQVAENIFEELDAPGEWFYDKKEGKLYLYPPANVNLDQSFLVGATQEELIRIIGTATQKVKYLRFSGFTLTHTHRTLFTRPYEGLSQGDWAIARAGAVFMQDAEHIEIKDCDFPNIGGNGVFMSGHNQDNTVTGCDFVHIGATAIATVAAATSPESRADSTTSPTTTPRRARLPGRRGPRGPLLSTP